MDLSFATIIIQIINFFIFFFIISKFLYGPVIKMLDERKAMVEREFDDAESIKAGAMSLKEEYEAKIRDAKKEAQDILKDAMSKAEISKNEIINEARKSAERERERAQEEIALEKEKTLKELNVYVADLAVSVAGKVLKSTLDDESQNRLMKEFVRKVESGNVS